MLLIKEWQQVPLNILIQLRRQLRIFMPSFSKPQFSLFTILPLEIARQRTISTLSTCIACDKTYILKTRMFDYGLSSVCHFQVENLHLLEIHFDWKCPIFKIIPSLHSSDHTPRSHGCPFMLEGTVNVHVHPAHC